MLPTQHQNVLVTGGTGFTGSHLVRRLLQRGHDVVVVDNQKGMFHDELENLGAMITIGSVTDKALMDRLAHGRDVIYHVAAAFREINVPKEVYWNVNVNGTRFLCEAALKHGIKKFIYCSTQGVHGNVPNPPGSEESPIAPEDYYQFTKYEGERVVQEFIIRGLDAAVLRPTAIYGPGDPGRWTMLIKKVAPGRFLMFGDGQTTYHPLYVENLVDAFELAAATDASCGQTYIIGDECYYTLNEIVKAIGQVLGIEVKITYLPFAPLYAAAVLTEIAYSPLKKDPPIFRRRVDWFRQYRGFSIDKARRELGYQPKIGLHEGLARTARWMKETGLLQPDTAKV